MKKTIILQILWTAFTISSCNLLDIQPVNSMTPETLEDYESVLTAGYPRSDFFMRLELLTDNVYANLSATKDADKAQEAYYTFSQNHILPGNTDPMWGQLYQSIFYANTVLDELSFRKPADNEKTLYETMRGEAYALRAYCYFYLINIYADIYSKDNLDGLGVPMPLDAVDVHKYTGNNGRETIGKVWNQIFEDIANAEKDLSGKASKGLYHFNYVSVQAFKARAYLFCGMYDEALETASYIIASKRLSDLNSLQARLDEKGLEGVFWADYKYFSSDYQNETLFFVGGRASHNIFYDDLGKFKPSVELLELATRDPDVFDFRKLIYRPYSVKEGEEYKYGPTVFSMFPTQTVYFYYPGFNVSECYLIRAECYMRKGQYDKGLEDLNKLLACRIKTEDFIPLKLEDFTETELFERLFEERRLETAFESGLRWMDLRRLGKPTITHEYDRGESYTLEQNDLRYVLQIPENEQENSPNMPLNPRK